MRDKPAFPNITLDMPVEGHPGMTMRQYYKAMAMQGFLSRGCGSSAVYAKDIARAASNVADAMLREDSEHSRVLSQSEIEEEK